jgi:hypothetical protein
VAATGISTPLSRLRLRVLTLMTDALSRELIKDLDTSLLPYTSLEQQTRH